jgi:hypothetical protein
MRLAIIAVERGRTTPPASYCDAMSVSDATIVVTATDVASGAPECGGEPQPAASEATRSETSDAAIFT